MGLYADKLMLEQKQESNFLQAINEAYFGRTPSINSLYNAFCDWREPFISTTKHFTYTSTNFYNEQHKKFCEMVKKQFNFHTFSYMVTNANTSVNSCTYGYGFLPFHNTSNDIIITKDGYRFKDSAMFSSIIDVYTDLIFNPEFTSEENFAIFLHEVGHNFQAAANKAVFALSAASGVFYIMANAIKNPIAGAAQVLITSNTSRTIINSIRGTITTNQLLGNLYTITNMMGYMLNKGINIINLIFGGKYLRFPIGIIYGAIHRLPEFLLCLITGQAFSRYYDERFADSFAASYGFGEALSSICMKFDKILVGDPTVNSVLNLPIIGYIYNLACIPGLLLWSIIDEHPTAESRAASIIKDMRRDLEDPGLDPELRKQLAIEVDNYEKSMNEYFTEAKKVNNPKFYMARIQEALYRSGGNVKMKMSELPFMKLGGFGAVTNMTKNDIISKTKIK